MYQNYLQQPTQHYGLKGRPVSSLDEAKAANIDFDGSLFLFPDITNQKIYTKQINMDGTVTFNMYELKSIPKEEDLFVTKKEFEDFISSLRSSGSQPAQASEFKF